ncbi:hypothetical protein BFW38_03910 [Terasakiispira papahanaumokuakeensis]|uniref:Uncharacterized protein n=1 Tax=Terasakiispira papahanaumokuakeensis TaxID=197479 RepID=A0A1E2V7J4_9GAMM|nr:hypothetical protein [Terasakiispira papahanaumokuakeensis]ODC02822.1 hypothetical protein BFW38_03910 [Terasakiispira papahanaumokuakeensis]
MTWNLLLLLMVGAYLLSPIRLALLVRRWRCECGPCPKACIGFSLHLLNALISFVFIGLALWGSGDIETPLLPLVLFIPLALQLVLALLAELCLGRWGSSH